MGCADYSGVKRVDLLLLMIFAERADQNGVDYADLDKLAERTGYPRQTIEASLRRLVRMGKLRRLTDDQGRLIANVWKMTAERRGPWHLYRVGWFNEQGGPIR
jgi:DNA-binding MarR family transcriptional regulator